MGGGLVQTAARELREETVVDWRFLYGGMDRYGYYVHAFAGRLAGRPETGQS